jgi:hypothetical protein
MPLAFSDDPDECTPFNVGSGDSREGPRIGGRPPAGIEPSRHAAARYFATLPLADNGEEEISLFFPMNGDVVSAQSGIVHDDGIDVVVHSPSRRGDGPYPTPLPEHPLVMGSPKSDRVADDGGELVPESGHKLGGRPFLIQNERSLVEAVRTSILAGYRQVVQFDFPAGGGDAVFDGPWPFVDGMFNLMGRRVGSEWEWRWFWQL